MAFLITIRIVLCFVKLKLIKMKKGYYWTKFLCKWIIAEWTNKYTPDDFYFTFHHDGKQIIKEIEDVEEVNKKRILNPDE